MGRARGGEVDLDRDRRLYHRHRSFGPITVSTYCGTGKHRCDRAPPGLKRIRDADTMSDPYIHLARSNLLPLLLGVLVIAPKADLSIT